MARIRTIKPEFWTSEQVMACSRDARLLFIGMWNFADDDGNLARSAKQIKFRVFPGDEIDCEPLIQELMTHGLVIEYSVSVDKYLHIPGFEKHQIINRKSKPHCPAYEDSLRTHCTLITEGSTGSTGREGALTSASPSVPKEQERGVSKSKRTTTPSNEGNGAKLANSEVWENYSVAYQGRYGVEPVRNAKVNSQIAQLVQRLGGEEAPMVAAWYVRHPGAFYVRAKHPVDLLLRDAEGLRTEWATGRTVTMTEAQQTDRTAANGNVFGKLIEEVRAQDALDGHAADGPAGAGVVT